MAQTNAKRSAFDREADCAAKATTLASIIAAHLRTLFGGTRVLIVWRRVGASTGGSSLGSGLGMANAFARIPEQNFV